MYEYKPMKNGELSISLLLQAYKLRAQMKKKAISF